MSFLSSPEPWPGCADGIRQTGPASGTVQQMGKGYTQWREIAGTDLRVHFEAAFARAVGGRISHFALRITS